MKPLLPFGLVTLLGCGMGTEERMPVRPPPPHAVAADGLHNVFHVSDRLLCGSSPDGARGFADLRRLGVRTVVSVDGARPDLAEAERHGLRYVHLPVGYDGIPRDRAWQLAKAARDLPGRVYVHCHHGKHRGPAAVAAIQLILDPTFTAADADRLLKEAGTDPKYTGLVGLPTSLQRPTPEELDHVPNDFPTAVVVPDLTARMVIIDGTWDRLKLVKAAGWGVPKGHADIDPPHEAVQLVEHYREAVRMPAAKGMPFAEAEAVAVELEKSLRAKDATKTEAAFGRSAKMCVTCHTAHRDPPKK